MRKYLPAFAIFAIAATPALAQTAPAPSNTAPQAKAKTVSKTVCQRIETDRGTGSRLGSTTKICKTVEVPAKEKGTSSTHLEGHNAQAH